MARANLKNLYVLTLALMGMVSSLQGAKEHEYQVPIHFQSKL